MQALAFQVNLVCLLHFLTAYHLDMVTQRDIKKGEGKRRGKGGEGGGGVAVGAILWISTRYWTSCTLSGLIGESEVNLKCVGASFRILNLCTRISGA